MLFFEQVLVIEWQYGDLILCGWVVDLNYIIMVLMEIQYCYVNGCMMCDCLINYVICQVCEDKLGVD